MKLQFATHTR